MESEFVPHDGFNGLASRETFEKHLCGIQYVPAGFLQLRPILDDSVPGSIQSIHAATVGSLRIFYAPEFTMDELSEDWKYGRGPQSSNTAYELWFLILGQINIASIGLVCSSDYNCTPDL